MQLFTDGWFLEAMDQYLELRLEHKKRAPTYVYLFTHKAAASFTEIFKGGRENYWGKYFIIFFSLEFESISLIYNGFCFSIFRLQALVTLKSSNIYSQ